MTLGAIPAVRTQEGRFELDSQLICQLVLRIVLSLSPVGSECHIPEHYQSPY